MLKKLNFVVFFIFIATSLHAVSSLENMTYFMEKSIELNDAKAKDNNLTFKKEASDQEIKELKAEISRLTKELEETTITDGLTERQKRVLKRCSQLNVDKSECFSCLSGIKLQNYEKNSLKARQDSNENWYWHIALSQMVPLWHDGCVGSLADDSWIHPYFVLNVDFGFYFLLTERDSSPVIGKRFNPKLVITREWLKDDKGYWELAVAHESNGQDINTQNAYFDKRNALIQEGQDPDFANDYLSRSWDYMEARFFYACDEQNSILFSGKYFTAIFQDEMEESNSWELGENSGLARSYFDGLSLTYKHSNFTSNSRDFKYKLALTYTTGYEDIGRFNTFELDIAISGYTKVLLKTIGVEKEFVFLDHVIPTQIWFKHGYNADLVGYTEKNTIFGIGWELKNFFNDI